MSRSVDKKIDKSLPNEWQTALTDARRKLVELQNKTRQLQRSIQIIQQKIAANEPWPTAHGRLNGKEVFVQEDELLCRRG